MIPSVTAATSLQAVESAKASEKGRLVPGAPDSMYWALGLGNQVMQIDPGTKTVVVRLGTAVPIPIPPTFGPARGERGRHRRP